MASNVKKIRRLKRDFSVYALRLAFAVVLSALVVGALALANKFSSESWRMTLHEHLAEWIFHKLSLEALEPYAREFGIEKFTESAKEAIRFFLLLVVFILLTVFFLGKWPLKSLLTRLAETTYDVIFAPYDDSILRPVRQPKAFDPLRGTAGEKFTGSLPWQAAQGSSRRAAYDALLDFARTGDGNPARGGRDSFEPFRAILVMGPLGSGKSRLAMEVARDLARREIWGGEQAANKRFARLGQRWRSRSLSSFRDSDPWDAGWLAGAEPTHRARSDSPYTNWQHRRQMKMGPWLNKLSAWRPRRPTIVLLDAPLPGDAAAVLGLMHAAAESDQYPYKHPVRLIIVSPAAPDDLQTAATPANEPWQSHIDVLAEKPIIIGEAEKFVAADIRGVATVFGTNKNPLWSSEAIDRLLKLTQGNPLLTEIAFAALLKAPASEVPALLMSLTTDQLLGERIKRLRAVLDRSKVTAIGRQALAAATLAGGAPPELLDAVLGHGAAPKQKYWLNCFLARCSRRIATFRRYGRR